ncbi:hypothetical protein Esti_001213 [Eimeria stiedai]
MIEGEGKQSREVPSSGSSIVRASKQGSAEVWGHGGSGSSSLRQQQLVHACAFSAGKPAQQSQRFDGAGETTGGLRGFNEGTTTEKGTAKETESETERQGDEQSSLTIRLEVDTPNQGSPFKACSCLCSAEKETSAYESLIQEQAEQGLKESVGPLWATVGPLYHPDPGMWHAVGGPPSIAFTQGPPLDGGPLPPYSSPEVEGHMGASLPSDQHGSKLP